MYGNCAWCDPGGGCSCGAAVGGAQVELIYCADGNWRFAEIAIRTGFLYGARLPHRGLHFPIHFADQDWRKPDREGYMTALDQHRPQVATVLDLECSAQMDEVLGWAEDAARYTSRVIIIPKASGVVAQLPRRVAGAEVVLGYSVPTSYGGTAIGLWEFDGWPVHLLGGSPHAQLRLRHYLRVVSADGNMMQKMAMRMCAYWVPGTARRRGNSYWPQLKETGEGDWGKDAIYEAFRRSCENVIDTWRGRDGGHRAREAAGGLQAGAGLPAPGTGVAAALLETGQGGSGGGGDCGCVGGAAAAGGGGAAGAG